MRSIASDRPVHDEMIASLQSGDVGIPQEALLDHAHMSPEAMRVARTQKCAPIVRKNADRQIVYGVVYAPGEIDAHGEIMLAPAIEQMAHKFMRLLVDKGGAVIDQQHDNVPVSAYPIESYIETQEGMDWPVGSWIMGVKIEDPVIWQKIKAGEINGYSFEAMVTKMPMVVEYEVPYDMLATTEEALGHTHIFFLEFDVQTGKIVNGITSMDLGHRHTITMGTATEMAAGPGTKAHAHRLPMGME